METEGMDEQRLARVRKLLAKAENPGVTPEEAETYTAKAAELIAAYGIDRALLAEADPTSDLPGDREVELEAPYAQEKATLLWAVARPLRCQGVLRRTYSENCDGEFTKHLTMHLFGYGSDLERLELLFTSLLLQLTSGLARTPVPPGEHVAAFRRTWILGFAAAVHTRLEAAEQGAAAPADRAETGRSVALVLADRTATVERLLQETYPAVRPGRRRSLQGGGYGGGYGAGSRADLGGSRLARSGRRSLGR